MPRFARAPRPARTTHQPFDVFLAVEERRSLRLFPAHVLDDALELAHEAELTTATATIARELSARDGGHPR